MVYKFTFKHRWQIKMHILSGVTLLPWLAILKAHFKHMDLRLYWHRVLFLSIMSVVNSILAIPDWLLYSRRIAQQKLHPEPVFILGHPRTGTTHLHNMLAQDPYFAFASTFHVGFPTSFLCLERAKQLLSPLLDPTRPMDNMPLHWDLPGEDEIAHNVLSGGVSPYMAIVLPGVEKQCFRQYYSFEGCPPHLFQRWLDAFMWFFKKVTLRWGGGKPLLIKSPCHTHRIGLWRRLFPRCKIIYIHRHPVEVFKSTAHMCDTYFWYTYLHRPSDEAVHRYIMDQYTLMYREYHSHRASVPADQLFELGLDQLEADPIACLHSLYHQFGWEERFEGMEGKFRKYCEGLKDFKKNQLSRLDAEVEAEVRQEWGPSFEAHGYL